MNMNDRTIQYDVDGNAGYFMSQQDVRDFVCERCDSFQISFEILAKMTDIDPDIIISWQAGAIHLEPEAFELFLQAFKRLNQGAFYVV